MGKYNVSIPEFSDNVAKVAAMVAEIGTASECITLYGALVAIRANLVKVETDETGKDAPKGGNAAARELGMSQGAMSKGLKVLLARCPEMVDAEASEIRERVIAFLVSLAATGETLTSVYNSLRDAKDAEGEDAEAEFDRAKAIALFATATAYANKYNQDADELFAASQGK